MHNLTIYMPRQSTYTLKFRDSTVRAAALSLSTGALAQRMRRKHCATQPQPLWPYSHVVVPWQRLTLAYAADATLLTLH